MEGGADNGECASLCMSTSTHALRDEELPAGLQEGLMFEGELQKPVRPLES